MEVFQALSLQPLVVFVSFLTTREFRFLLNITIICTLAQFRLAEKSKIFVQKPKEADGFCRNMGVHVLVGGVGGGGGCVDLGQFLQGVGVGQLLGERFDDGGVEHKDKNRFQISIHDL